MKPLSSCKLINKNLAAISHHSTPSLNPFRSKTRSISDLSLLRDLGTCVSYLQACASHHELSKGKELHSWMLVNGFHTSPFSITSLINLYSKCNHPIDALLIFRATHDPTLFAWNAILAGLVTNSLPKQALHLYGEMRSKACVFPDKFTYPSVIKACSDVDAAGELRKIHAGLYKAKLESDIFVSSALIHSYMKLGFLKDAEKVFDELPERDVVLWNAMVNGFAQVGQFASALGFFHRMGTEGITPSRFTVTGIISVYTSTGDLLSGKKIHAFVLKVGYDPDVAISNSLIDMYGKSKSVEEAVEIFESMPERDILSWNSMISACEYSGDHGGTLRLFDRMRFAGVHPDPVTISAVLPACAHMAALIHGRQIHAYMVVNGLRRDGDVFVDNAVMDMYAKCGALEDAGLVFNTMDGRDVASWNILIGAYAAHGRGPEALGLFSNMCEARVSPDEVTFVGVLSACSHAGMVGPGREILRRMVVDHGVVPTAEHYACVVDMLGRAGQLVEAHEMASGMPMGPNVVVWRAYLAACRVHGDTDRAVEAARRVVEMEPEHCGSYVLMSNVYGSAGRYDDVSEIRRAMRERNVRKGPGCSWIELGSGVHTFVTGDRAHEECDGIYDALHGLIGRLREFGYVPDLMRGE